MSLDTSFLNLVRGSRLANYVGLKMTDEQQFKYASDYTYVEIPAQAFVKDGEATSKILRNQYVRVIPACSVDVKGSFKVQVEPNAALAEYGMIQPGYYLHPGSGLQIPGFFFHARRDMELSDIPGGYAVRLYLRT